MKNEKCTLCELEYGKKTKKEEKCEKDLVGPGIWQVTLKNVKNEKQTLQDLEYVEKLIKRGK